MITKDKLSQRICLNQNFFHTYEFILQLTLYFIILMLEYIKTGYPIQNLQWSNRMKFQETQIIQRSNPTCSIKVMIYYNVLVLMLKVFKNAYYLCWKIQVCEAHPESKKKIKGRSLSTATGIFSNTENFSLPKLLQGQSNNSMIQCCLQQITWK